ncbi:MAG: hypothetical protein KatS3mg038_3589 [Candidatus Kapaibacterium sp.]|nr:MAG: hypothetical protein KatS3mg038_3589 [Candidatus Kapabacteria bacterium]
MLTMFDNLLCDAIALRLATQAGERVPLHWFAGEKLTHTHTHTHTHTVQEEIIEHMCIM